MNALPGLSTLGSICGSGQADDMLVLDRATRKNSVRRMSIIEDGSVAEVLYLIPKRSIMEQLPHLNPDDYVLCEKMPGVPLEFPQASQSHGAAPARAPARRPVQCFRCGEACKGEVLRVQARYFHLNCFTCTVCGCDLARGGFFLRGGAYLCTLDYQRLHGTRCQGCGENVEGEVVTALGRAYHPACFICTSCRRPFPTGDRVTFHRKECLCQDCCVKPHPSVPNHNSFSNNCVGCGMDIKNGQALLALRGQWHLGCFKCSTCHRLLTGEYITRHGLPYCERDYQLQFGVSCDACKQFIVDKVLEAGDRHFHPSCARCCRCDILFREGEEMFLQASTMWHPDCRSNSRGESRSQRSTTPSLHYFYPPPELQATRSSSESVSSRPGSALFSSSGHTIYAKVDDQVVDYRDLAALPRDKAILDIERPDLLSYSTAHQPRNQQASRQDRPLPAEISPERGRRSVGSIHRHSYTPSVSPQHFHRPAVTSCLSDSRFSSPFSDHFLPLTAEHQHNLYMKPPIYKQYDPPPVAYQTSSLPGYGRHSGVFYQHSSYGLGPDRPGGYVADGRTGAKLSCDPRPSFSHLDRGLSMPNLLEHTVYPYEMLAVTSRGRQNLPRNVDRTRLERYLSPESFFKVFEMDIQHFNQLPLWKRNDLKKIVNLF